MSAPRTPVAEALRGFAVPYAATGNHERAAGLVQAADYVDEQSHLLTGKALAEAMVAMLGDMIGPKLEEHVADVVAALRSGEAGGEPPAPKSRAKRKRPTPLSVAPLPPMLKHAPTMADAAVGLAGLVFGPPMGDRLATPDGMKPGARKILVALVQHWPDRVTRPQLTALVGFKKSARDTYVSTLVTRGYAARVGADLVATDEGRRAVPPDVKPLPTGSALLAHWLGDRTIKPGARHALQFVASFYPHPVSKERIGEEIRAKKSARDTYLSTLRSRRLIEDTGRGHVRASPHLFDAPKQRRAGGAR